MKISQLPIAKAIVDHLSSRSDHESIKAIMESKGDITKVKGYPVLAQCINNLLNIDAGRNTLGKPLRVAKETHEILLRNRATFIHAFKSDENKAVKLIYANATAGLWHLVSLICAECLIFIKGSDDIYRPIVNNVKVDELSKSLIVTRLEQFNDKANKFGFEKLMSETSQIVDDESLHEFVDIATIGLVFAGFVALLLIIRDLCEKFYVLRGAFSRWLEVQAKFLEMNAYSKSLDPITKEKQESYAKQFRALAERISIDDVETEKEAKNLIQANDRTIESLNSRNQAATMTGDLL
jgi:hypothetical protein